MKIKIMSFNVLNGWNTSKIGERDDLAASVILSQMPDIIGLQEVDTGYRLADSPLPELISEHYAEASDTHTSWNPIFYKKGKFSPVDYGEIPFNDGTEYPKYPFGNGSHFRTVSYAVLKNTETDEMLTVFNLHYDMTQDVNKKLENQLSESRQVIALAKTVLEKYGTNALFVTGDYNSRIDGVPCEQMLANGFTDTYDLADEKDNIGSCAKLGAPLCGEYRTNAIDHVFYMGGKELRVNKYETVGSIRAASDHAPVLVTVEIN